MEEKILEALAEMDSLDDAQWTSDGFPKVDYISSVVGESVTRQQIVDAAPDFNRQKSASGGDPAVVDSDLGTSSEEQETVNEDSTDEDSTDEDPVTEEADLEDFDPEMSLNQMVGFMNSLPSNQLDGFKEHCVGLISDVDSAVKKMEMIRKNLKRSIKSADNRMKAENPNNTEQSAISEFIQAQTELRASKFARQQELAKIVGVDSLDPRAPIDKAMARRTSRGVSRPVISK